MLDIISRVYVFIFWVLEEELQDAFKWRGRGREYIVFINSGSRTGTSAS